MSYEYQHDILKATSSMLIDLGEYLIDYLKREEKDEMLDKLILDYKDKLSNIRQIEDKLNDFISNRDGKESTLFNDLVRIPIDSNTLYDVLYKYFNIITDQIDIRLKITESNIIIYVLYSPNYANENMMDRIKFEEVKNTLTTANLKELNTGNIKWYEYAIPQRRSSRSILIPIVRFIFSRDNIYFHDWLTRSMKIYNFITLKQAVIIEYNF